MGEWEDGSKVRLQGVWGIRPRCLGAERGGWGGVPYRGNRLLPLAHIKVAA